MEAIEQTTVACKEAIYKMTASWRNWKLGTVSCLVIGSAIASSTESVLAQITPDTTLGNENSTVTSTGRVDTINGGATRGANLFHSFGEFNIDDGRAAVFTNPTGIENILMRVTGGNPSNILGTLGVAGNANLFLMNPNGIIFGSNARLDIGGSFVGTTANAVRLGDTGLFSASEPASSNLLTVRPSALFFNAVAAQEIVNRSQAQGLRGETNSIGGSVGLQVPQGKTLALVGGRVLFEGGNSTAPGGRIELGSIAQNGIVKLIPTAKGWLLNYDGIQNFQDIQLSQQAIVDAGGASGGDIQVHGKQVTFTDGSQVLTRSQSAPGTLRVTASESVELIGTTKDESNPTGLFASGIGDTGVGGEITVETGRLIVKDGAAVSTTSFSASGAAGIVTVNAALVELDGTSKTGKNFSNLAAGSRGRGNGGKVTINTKRLIIKNGAGVYIPTTGAGDGGILTVNATESVDLMGTSNDGTPSALLTATLGSSGSKNAGNLTINTSRLSLAGGAVVSVSSFEAGEAGRLEVNSDFVLLSGASSKGLPSGLYANNLSTGNAGNLTINTRELLVQNGAVVSVSAGEAPPILFAGPSFLQNVGIDVPKTLANLQFQTLTGIGGDAGDLEISARSLKLNEGIISATTASGNGGNINLNVRDLLLLRSGAQISTTAGTAQAGGNGGNINIDAPSGFVVAGVNENNDITANAFSGSGGRVTINSTGIFGMTVRSRKDLVRLLGTNLAPQQLPTNDITAISQTSPNLSGTVALNIPDADLNSGLVNVPTIPVDTEVAQACTPGSSQANSKFVVTGRGGLPPTPTEALNPDAIAVDWVTLQPESKNNYNAASSTGQTTLESKPIVEAQGWIINKKGEVVLTASVPTATPHNSWQTLANCPS